MKKVLCLLMVLVMAIGCISISASAAEYGTVLYNNVALVVGQQAAVAHNGLVDMPAAPVEVDGEVLIPLYAIPSLFSGYVSYDAGTGYIGISFGVEKNVGMLLGNKNYTVDGRGYSFDVAPQLVNGVVMVPVIALGRDIIGQTVVYDAATKLVLISGRAVLNPATDAAVITTIVNAIATRNLPEISVPTSYQLDWGVAEDVVGGLGSGSQAAAIQTVVAKPVNVTASQEPEPANNRMNAFDGDPISTRWAVQGEGNIVADLGSTMLVTEIKVYWWRYDERTTNFDVEVSADGSSYTSIFSGGAMGKQAESYPVNQNVRYVRINSHGNDSGNGDWNSLLECEIYVPAASAGADQSSSGASGQKISAPTGTKVGLTASMLNAQTHEAENPPASAVDGNPGTWWAASRGSAMIIDLGSEMTVSTVGVRMRQYDDSRTVGYGISVSADGSSYTPIFTGSSPEGGGVAEYYAVGQNARYVKIDTNGNSISDWASVAEVEVYTGAAASAGAAGGTVAAGGYANMTSINGNFVIAVAGTTNVLTVSGDNLTLGVQPNSQDSRQIWSRENSGSGFAVKNSATGFCMDVSEMSYDEGGQIIVWEGNGGENQTWIFEIEGDGYYIKSAMSGLYLSNNGGSIQQRSKDVATKWVIADPNASATAGGIAINGEFQIKVYGSATALSVESDNLSLGTAASSKSNDRQLWTLESASGGVAFKNKSTGFCMDVSDMSYDEGGSIIVWEGNGGENQTWILEQDGSGFYIKSAMSGLYLSNNGGSIQQLGRGNATKWEIAGDGVQEIVPVVDPNMPVAVTEPIEGEFRISVYGTAEVLSLNTRNSLLVVDRRISEDNEVWTMGVNANGLTIKNISNNLVLDVPGGSASEGIRVSVWEDNGGANQAWELEKVGGYYLIKNAETGLYLTYDNTGVRQKSAAYATKWSIRVINQNIW